MNKRGIAFALLGLWLWSVGPATAGPTGYAGLPPDAYQRLDLTGLERKSLSPGGRFLLVRGRGEKASSDSFRVEQLRAHANGDVSISAHNPVTGASLSATLGGSPGGDSAIFGTLHEAGRHVVLTTEGNGSWAVALPETGLHYNLCGLDHAAPPTPKPAATERTDKGLNTTIDIMVIYNQAFVDRYPGGMARTRVNHFMDIANVTLANSVTSVGVRLVRTQLVDYSNDNTNFEARNDMADALADPDNAAPGLERLNRLRGRFGADLIIMLRPHDIELRGSCGIAFFPDNDPTIGVNVTSDGMSSWSLCADDTFTHEIGHNLGAGHQIGQGGAFFDPRGSAFINSGQYTTVMGSFGTGRPDRFRGLFMFSNPNVDCGGRPCGTSVEDNAGVIRDTAPAIAAYREAVSEEPLPQELARSTSDIDGDGVIDWDDHFPFDATEQSDADRDGFGDGSDVFPNDGSENLDTDNDGQGNNADPDDDGDGRNDVQDAFPLDPNETTDSDGDGVGDQADAQINSALEFLNTDGDAEGDNRDLDDDNDGFEELSTTLEDLLVISVGNSRILRFDAATGQSRGIEVLPDDGLLTFQSDLAFRDGDNTLLYLSDSSIKRISVLDRSSRGTYIQAYDDTGQSPSLGTGFPTGLAVRPQSFSPISTSEFYVATGTSPDIRFGSGAERPSFLAPRWSAVDGEEFKDLVGDGADVLALGRATRSLYRGPQNQPLVTLSGPGTAWMSDPQRMAVHPDGRLLVTDAGRNTVVAVDGQSGQFLGDLVDIGAAGYSAPTGVAVTRDGEVLVSVSDQNAILAFDGDSGAFLGERVRPGQGGLSDPQSMILVPQLIDRFATDPDRVIRPNPGLWFNSDSNGRGFDIEVFGNVLTAIWYAFDEAGNPLWYYSQGILDGFEYSGELSISALTEAGFELNPIGTLNLTFVSEREAQMSWQIGTESGGESLQWLEISVEPAPLDHTGLWGRPDGPGWGLSLATQGDTTVAIGFLYDSDGQPRWVISDPVVGDPPFPFEMFALFSDTLCPTCSGESTFERVPAGTMDITVPEIGRWDSNVQFPQPLVGDWLLDGTDLIRFSETPDRPR